MKHVQESRDRPPTTWTRKDTNLANDEVVEIDAEVGIYAMPSLDPSTQNPAIWHWCDTGQCWLVSGTRAHQVVSADPLHLEPSLLFACCGRHGFIRGGRWQGA